MVALVLVMSGWLAPGFVQTASAQTTTTCAAAATKGADGPIDYGAYCWIDFTPLSLSQARSGSGQNFRVNLRGGAYLTFNLKITPGNTAGNNMYAVSVPSWSGAAFGNSAFNDIPGRPILYQDQANQNGPRDTVTLSSLTLHANGSTELPFVFVAADGESSNQNETLSFTTTGQPWALVSAPGISNPGRNMPMLSPATPVGSSTGSQTVNITGTTAGSQGEGSYVFTTDNSPGTVTATLLGGGLQGVLFGVKYHTIGLSLVKTHVGNFVAGGSGKYTIHVTNTVIAPTVNPPSSPQPVRVVDTLPVGLTFASVSGTDWTCTNAGQVVTCNTSALQDLTASRTFPPITLDVNVAANAPATLTNVAEVSDPTTSTLVFNVCETPGNGICPGSATSNTGDPTVIVRPDLSTSTKSVVDLDGGDALPNDILRYTISLVESANAPASNVTVSDPVPAGLLAPTSLDPSSTCSGTVSAVGGVPTITGINLAAGGSCTLVFDMQISGSAGIGQQITNTATITVPNGTGGTVVEDSVVVRKSDVLQSGSKYLYLRNQTASPAFVTRLSRSRPTQDGNAVVIAESSAEEWELTPAIPTGETLVLPATQIAVSGNIVMEGWTDRPTSRNRTIRLSLRTSSGVGLGGNVEHEVVGGPANYTYNFDLRFTSLADRTLGPGEFLILTIRNRENANNREIRVHQRNGTNWPADYSFLTFTTSTVINVDSIGAFAQPAASGNAQKAAYVQGDHVYIRATVSDPFGTADISDVSVVIRDATGTAVASGGMTQLPDANISDGSLSYEYDFTVPANPRLGGWTAIVTAKEGVENLVWDDANVGFVVNGKLTLGKSWGAGAIAGNAVNLTIAGGATTAAGSSVAGGATSPATATSAAGTILTLAESFTSGSIGNYTVTLACARDKDGVAIRVSGSGLTRTVQMPADSAVTCAWTNAVTTPLTLVKSAVVYSDPVNGTTNPKAIPGALVTYLLIVIAPAGTSTDQDSVVVADAIPEHTVMFVSDLPDQPGDSPIGFAPSTSGMTLGFAGLGDSGDDVDFSSDGGITWTYAPTAGADGTDPLVTHVRFRPKGTLAGGANVWLGFRVRVK
jgi:uncharacterized repeat protein (TIGR01451 family)